MKYVAPILALILLGGCAVSPEQAYYNCLKNSVAVHNDCQPPPGWRSNPPSTPVERVAGQQYLDKRAAETPAIDRVLYQKHLIISPTAPPVCPYEDKTHCKDW